MADRPPTDNREDAILVLLCTCPEEAQAREIAQRLVEERLAACVNLVPGVGSIYRWEGRVESTGEVLLLIKTTARRHDALAQRLAELHPYEVPEILALPVVEAAAAYAAWVRASCAG
ncbi:divalent-cation tolerance protein CutA [Inmirania thermothiophila]|uniref:Periplasmic divalent cation tolerance protein n=1 Tax=Inmirania thermothiophila TaxID=1750597 RepID=A0A3N1XTL9_9GAMM|nr:divalent-cation tolerance protein CutA [Inmirania thermothiophila]ROR29598.1 periplasmic divalent cation tolerance protein [Inmirania thermothiophila]